jgi:hypothetical protein
MGNRDINKLRLSSEINTPGELGRLHDGILALPLHGKLSAPFSRSLLITYSCLLVLSFWAAFLSSFQLLFFF